MKAGLQIFKLNGNRVGVPFLREVPIADQQDRFNNSDFGLAG
jgi:hypothetical protein